MSFLIGFIIFMVLLGILSSFAPKPTQQDAVRQLYGEMNHQMVCMHCNAVGKIRTKATTQKKGVSGGKATAAILTGGVSLLATGLSRKEINTQAHCTNCNNTWIF